MSRISSESNSNQKNKTPMDSQKKLIIAVVSILVVLVLLVLIGGGVMFMKFLNRFGEDDSSQITTVTYSIKQRSDFQNGYSGRLYESVTNNAYDLYGEEGAAELEGETTLPKVTSNYGTGSEFQYGTIKGTTYKSKFSGITFDAPKGWTLTGATKSTVTPTSVLDLDARNSTGSMSVKLQYFSLSGGSYSSTNQVLNALKAQVGSDAEITSKSRTISGLNFKGFAFDGLNGQESARSQVMVTQVQGYALVLQVVAPTQSDVDNILKNFS